jgi:YkoY family integral membrane protein
MSLLEYREKLVFNPADIVTILATIGMLVVLEGLLSADNALVLAVMVKHLPHVDQKKALRYGIFGAFAFRLVAVLFAGILLDFWIFKIIGGGYLLYLALENLLKHGDDGDVASRERSFWGTVIGVELADIAFSIDSILAAVAMAEGLPKHLHSASLLALSLKTWTVYVGGVLGIITMRFVAGKFIGLLRRYPRLETGAYYLVLWISFKLIGSGLHNALAGNTQYNHLPLEMNEYVFWGGMLTIFASCFLLPSKGKESTPT